MEINHLEKRLLSSSLLDCTAQIVDEFCWMDWKLSIGNWVRGKRTVESGNSKLESGIWKVGNRKLGIRDWKSGKEKIRCPPKIKNKSKTMENPLRAMFRRGILGQSVFQPPFQDTRGSHRPVLLPSESIQINGGLVGELQFYVD